MNLSRRSRTFLGVSLAVSPSFLAAGCMRGDPAPRMIAMVDGMPREKRPPNWDETKALMTRTAPAVGAVAPDFTLPVLGANGKVQLSTFLPGQPKVLIFGSFT